MTDVSALYGLRLATPRLELRLGSRAELEALAEVAKAGIHPPDEMPFAVPWTDASGDPCFVAEFVAHHEEALESWRTDEWRLNLLVFHDGAPVSTPLRWDEVRPGLDLLAFTMDAVLERVAKEGDLFARVLEGGQSLGAALRALR